MLKIILAAAAVVFFPQVATARPAVRPPALIVVISVDQLSSDLFDEYRPHFTAGFARLAGGTVFRNAYHGFAATETCPGHSAILTGALPSRSGVVANMWIDQSVARDDKSVYCAEDERAPGSTSVNYTVSPVHLKVPTLGDILKSRSAESRNVAIAGKDRSAVMMGGHGPDQRWYLAGSEFATDLKGAPVPASVAAVNALVAKSLADPRTPLEPTPLCESKARLVAVEGGANPVGNGRLGRSAGDVAAMRASPEFDGIVLALAAALAREMRLGGDGVPDILSIGLSGTDYVGHAYGSGGQEMCLQLLSLDREMGDFFKALDRMGLDYAVMLTADHGGLDIPERLRLQGVADAARVDPELAAAKVGQAVAARLKLSGPVLLGDFAGDIHIDDSLGGPQRAAALAEALANYRAHPQVAGAFSSEEVARVGLPTGSPDKWTLIERLRASFDPQRSGDILVALKPNITPIADTSRYIATHGSPWDYDRRVPILFWRSGMAPSSREEAVATVDIMPTLAAMLRLGLAAEATDGRCLTGLEGVDCPSR